MRQERLTLTEIDNQFAAELPDRQLYAVAVGAGGLIGIGVAIDHTLNDIHVIEDSTVCVNVAAINSAAAC
jgi:hypothetical protein